jgi:glycosyltransferase involved in cell wall biosynthesis
VRILNLVHQSMPEFVGGTELYTRAIGQALAARGHEGGTFARSFALPAGLHSDESDGVRLYRASDGPAGAARRFAATFRAPNLHSLWSQALESFAPDVVLVQHLMGLPVSALELLRERQIPYAITLLDYWWVCANANLLTNAREEPCDGPRAFLNCTACAVSRGGTPAAWAAAPALTAALAARASRLRSALEGARLLVTPSDFVTAWYRDHGAPPRVQTARWGIMPPPAPLPPRRPRSEGTLRLLYVGGLAPNKGVHIALEALTGVQGDWRLQIAGDPAQRPDYVARLHALASPRVEFVGRLDRAAVWAAMAESDIVLVPSLWHETFCLVAHEAVAAGAVLFASQMGALPEAIRDGHGGRLLPAGDVKAWRSALQAALDDRAWLESMRASAPRVRLFDEHVDDLLALYARSLWGAAAE